MTVRGGARGCTRAFALLSHLSIELGLLQQPVKAAAAATRRRSSFVASVAAATGTGSSINVLFIIIIVAMMRTAVARFLGADLQVCGQPKSARDSGVRPKKKRYCILYLPTWLILPVVICLSQRLSHACVSTGRSKAKPRMAH